MKLTTAALVLAAALGASSHPNGHAHRFLHRRAIDSSSRFFMSTRPDPPVDKAAKGSDPAPAPAPDSVPKPTYPAPEVPASPEGDIPPSTDPSKPGPGGFDWSRDNGLGVGIEPFCKGMSKRATEAQNAYPGFTGPPGQFGCNLKLIRASVVEKYPYTLTINNVVDKDQKCVCWNKVGKDGKLNGFWKGKEVLDFDLGSQKSQSVAVHPASIGGCSCDVGQQPQTTSFGQWAGTWVEFDFVSDVNQGHSGADASCLAAASEKLNIPGMKVYRIDGEEKPSTICPGGSGTNAYVDGTKYADGIGLNMANSTTVRLVADVGHKC